MNKKRILIISIISAVLITGGWTAWAAGIPSDTTASSAVDGTFKAIVKDGSALTVTTTEGDRTVPLAKSVWVYRNEQKAQLPDLKAGDRIETVLNSKDQAAYIKASSADAVAEAPQTQAAQAPAEQNHTAAPAPLTPPAAAVQGKEGSPQPLQVQSPAQPDSQHASPGLKELQIEVNGKHFNLHIIQKREDSVLTKYEINLNPAEGGAIRLQGNEAAAWIRQLLAPVDLQSSNARQQLVQEIVDHYGIAADELHAVIKTQWDRTDSEQETAKPSAHDVHDKKPDKAKHNDKSEGKGRD